MKQIANYQVSLKAILKNLKWEVLLLKTVGKITYWDYDFPWWRIDDDEFEVPYLDILAREIREELWDKLKYEIKNQVVSLWRFRASDHQVIYLTFEWLILDETIETTSEHAWYEFVKLEEIVLEDYFKSWMLEVAKMYLGK